MAFVPISYSKRGVSYLPVSHTEESVAFGSVNCSKAWSLSKCMLGMKRFTNFKSLQSDLKCCNPIAPNKKEWDAINMHHF